MSIVGRSLHREVERKRVRARGSRRAGERRAAAQHIGAHRPALRFSPVPDTLGLSSLESELLDEDDE
jgi:hypothetical protein